MLNNALQLMIARGGKSAAPEAFARGLQRGNALAEIQRHQATQNALSDAAPVLASQGPRAAMNALASQGQFEPVNALYNAVQQQDNRESDRVFQRERFEDNQDFRQRQFDATQTHRGRQTNLQQQRLQGNQDFRNRQFSATQDYRNRQLDLSERSLTQRAQLAREKATQKAATKAKGGKPTVDSAKAAGFFDRMFASEKVLSDPANVAAAIDRGNVAREAVAGLTRFRVGGEDIPVEFQKFDQAQRDFINATLRRESGAVISEQEFDNARQQYFPQPGDSPEKIAQKAQNRAIVIAGMKRAGLPSLGGQSEAGPSSDLKSKYGLE